ncbi:MAG: hypothetical protein H7A25_26625 [Leptospiraceae bacterium]|nr:hypothetical protein [Leptospiraceae bacterium]MCP5503503.1 hypothetical protein [Leptospiraceae bacterium]
MAFEKKSEQKLFGIPLYHIVIGKKPGERQKTAFGFFALGRKAIGFIAIGQFASGIITIAQFGVGLFFGLGQAIFGLGITLCQFGTGMIIIAQFAIGFFSIGQFALGYMGTGQLAFHYISKNWLSSIYDFSNISFIDYLKFLPLIILPLILFPLGIFLTLFIKNSIADSILEGMYQASHPSIITSDAKLLSIERTSMRINRVPVYKLNLEFYAPDGRKILTSKRSTLYPETAFGLVPGTYMKIAYNKNNPKRVIFIE